MESQRVGHDRAALTSLYFTSHISNSRVEFLYKNIWNNFKMHEMNLNKFQTMKWISINFKPSTIANVIKHVVCVCVCVCVCVSVCLQFGKLSSGHRTGKGQFSFQFQRRVMPKNVQATIQLSSFRMLARLCSKSFMIVLSSSWTENFQVGKLGFAEAAELDFLKEFLCFFYDLADVGNLISSFSAFSESGLKIWKFKVLILLKPGLENLEHYFASVWDECSCAVVWT